MRHGLTLQQMHVSVLMEGVYLRVDHFGISLDVSCACYCATLCNLILPYFDVKLLSWPKMCFKYRSSSSEGEMEVQRSVNIRKGQVDGGKWIQSSFPGCSFGWACWGRAAVQNAFFQVHHTVGGRNPAPLYLHPKTNPRTPSSTLGQCLVVTKKEVEWPKSCTSSMTKDTQHWTRG